MVIESGEFSPNTAPFTASWPGDTVAHREKGGLKLLYSLPVAPPLVAPPVLLSETPGAIRNRAPLPGEHTDSILRWLGYADGEIERLRATSVV